MIQQQIQQDRIMKDWSRAQIMTFRGLSFVDDYTREREIKELNDYYETKLRGLEIEN